MLLRIFTLRFNPATESFNDDAIESFLADKEVISIRDYFFVKDGRLQALPFSKILLANSRRSCTPLAKGGEGGFLGSGHQDSGRGR